MKGERRVNTVVDQPIGHIIRSARQKLSLSQYDLADKLAAISGKPTMGRDRVARWERGRQVPRREWRQWLSVVLDVPMEWLDEAAAIARRQSRLGHAAVTATPATSGPARRPQGTPALLPVFRSRVQAGILAATLLNPNRAFSLTELADHAGGSLASVSKESKLLEEAGILTTRNEGAIRLIRAVTDKPLLAPLTELVRITYGVPQVIGEELGNVPGVARIALTGTWAERFAGVAGPEPESIQVRLIPDRRRAPDQQALRAAAHRAERRLNRPVRFVVAAPGPQRGAHNGATRPPQRNVRLPRQRDPRPVVEVAPVSAPDGPPPGAEAWPDGADVVGRFLDEGQLELFGGPTADSRPFLDLAASHLSSADNLVVEAAGSAFVLVCQAAQLIASGLLAAQGLRPAAGSPGDVVSRSVVAQFGPQFEQVELLRQRLLALANPAGRDNRVTAADVEALIPAVQALLKTSQDIALELNLFA